MCVCVCGHHFQQIRRQPGMVANPVSAMVSITTVMRHLASPELISLRNFYCVNDDVHYHRESAGTGPVVLKVAQQTGASYSGNLTDQ